MKTALITGASSGIGKELARIFASKNHDCVIVARNLEKLIVLKKELESKYAVSVHCIQKDLAVSDAPKEIYDELESLTITIDYLVNNAGIGELGNFTENAWEKEEQMISLNIMAVTHLTKLFLKDMVARKRGKIMNLASTAAFQPGPGMAVYFASKAFVLHFSEAVNYEVRKSGVTVTALWPGPTESDFMEEAHMENSRLFKGKKVATSKEVAEFGFEAMMKGKSVAVHGFKNQVLTNSNRFATRDLVTAIAAKFQEKI